MPRYVFLMRANPLGASNMLRYGAAGASRQRRAIRELGGTVSAQYVVTGGWDLILVADLPDEAACLAVSLGAEAGGFYVNALRTHSASDLDQARALYPELTEASVQSAVAAKPSARPSRGKTGQRKSPRAAR